ncbi:hypothetical protein TIFTF001_003077, partial [Ficus carica]
MLLSESKDLTYYSAK